MESERARKAVTERENQGGEIDMPDEETKSQSTAIAPQIEARRGMMPISAGGAMQPKDLGETMELSRLLSNSGMVPPDYQGNPGNVFVALQMGAELGLAPMQAIQNIAVINGRPSLWGDAMLAVVMAHPAYQSIEEMDLAAITEVGYATCILSRKGAKPHTSTFSVEDAQTAGLWKKKGPWTQYPSRMLLLRARAFACRNVFPDALRGIRCVEEDRDNPGEVQAVTMTVKSSVPTNIADRIRERQLPKTGNQEPEAEAEDGKREADARGYNAEAGELSPEDEKRMVDEQANADAEGGKP